MKMRKATIAFIALAMAQTAAAQKLVVKNDVADCGDVLYRQPVTATFNLKNDASKKLKIREVLPDCGCVNVKFPKDVSGNNDFTITATYNAETMGTFDKAIVVYTNAKEEPTILRLRGRVKRDMQDFSGTYPIQMGSLRVDKQEVVFDNVNRGEQPTADIHILNNSSKTYTPTLMHMPSYLTMETSKQSLRPGESGIIRLVLNSDKLRSMGLTQSTVYVARYPGDKVSDETAIDVSAVLLPDLSKYATTGAIPKIAIADQEQQISLGKSDPVIDFGAFDGKKKIQKTITVRNDGQAPLEISSLQMFTSGIDLTLAKRKLAPGESTTLKIKLKKEVQKLKTAPRILMITNDPHNAKITIWTKFKSN